MYSLKRIHSENLSVRDNETEISFFFVELPIEFTFNQWVDACATFQNILKFLSRNRYEQSGYLSDRE